MIERVREMLLRHEELEQRLASPEVTGNPREMEKISREYNSLQKSLPLLRRYADAWARCDGARYMLKSESDHELQQMARDEIEACERDLASLDDAVKKLLVPADPDDLKNAVVEVRAGTGGVEAGLFAADLYRMYTHFAESKGWKVDVLSFSEGELGGVKEVIFGVEGAGAYGILKYESGVHRVQRVPQTEAQGRIHTSAATVAVFPEADEIEVTIDPKDIRIDVFRAGGKGGQHVNKTESAVRIVHLPTGITVSCQDEKSQHKNKAKAMKVLQSRLYDMTIAEKHRQESASRKSMVSTGDRSAKIRTYNFPQNRVTDHRINFTLHTLDDFIAGNIAEMSEALAAADINERLKPGAYIGYSATETPRHNP